jgi:hypothetical protein
VPVFVAKIELQKTNIKPLYPAKLSGTGHCFNETTILRSTHFFFTQKG